MATNLPPKEEEVKVKKGSAWRGEGGISLWKTGTPSQNISDIWKASGITGDGMECRFRIYPPNNSGNGAGIVEVIVKGGREKAEVLRKQYLDKQNDRAARKPGTYGF